jgi:hypothetical protein
MTGPGTGRGPGARVALAVGALVGLGSATATAQPFAGDRTLVVMVGAPVGGARMARIDASRRALAPSILPSSRLQTEWRTALGFIAQQGPLVDSKGRTYVVGESGEVVVIGRDGTVLSRTATRGTQPGPAALLSDDTLVFVDGAGEAVAVRDGAVIWRSRFGRASPLHAAPVALDDGGVVVASGPDLAVLDSTGAERARVVLPEPTSHPLLSALGKVVVVGDSGAVWTWAPSAEKAVRVGGFGSDIDGSAALVDAHTLVATARTQTHLSTVDLIRGVDTKLVGPLGGERWLGPPAVDSSGVVCAVQITPAGEVAVAIDASGSERGRTLLAGPVGARALDKVDPPSARAPLSPPSTASTPPTPSRIASTTPLVVDGEGHLAFATLAGSIGVATGLVAPVDAPQAQNAVVELVADACAPSPGRPGAEAAVVGLAPLPPRGLVALCRSGLVVAVKEGRPAGGSGSPRL